MDRQQALEYLRQKQEFMNYFIEQDVLVAAQNVKLVDNAATIAELNAQLSVATDEIQRLHDELNTPKPEWEEKADKMIHAALYADFLNIPYKFGAEWINNQAFDCSSFTLNLHLFVGIDIPRGALAQSRGGTEVKFEELRKGDLCFFDINGGNNGIGHVALYMGDNAIIQTNTPTSGINIQPLTRDSKWGKMFMKACRYI